MSRTGKLLRQNGTRFLLLLLCLTLLSWPFWGTPENRAPAFMFVYFLITWVLIIGLLVLLVISLGGEKLSDETADREVTEDHV